MIQGTHQTQDWDDGDEMDDHFELRLYIAGASSNSIRAIENLREICEKYIKERYTLRVIDVHQEKSLASQQQLVALPLLVKLRPSPERRLIGDMSDTQKVLKGLGISGE
ncbi:circadian clock protein KaiB [Dyadobacter sp. SG02]|uniref:circadian clock KaiB family protein n=1 Tax=Dyadobacter sp. SG02 TaxID=1855291 RepID=UPI0008D7D3F5|nr:circadian clock KaiB family protein [Dyadobacter sp. SG02]SEI56323.1 circadian clock protein KaiB [Dyadobacter sp. SG02]